MPADSLKNRLDVAGAMHVYKGIIRGLSPALEGETVTYSLLLGDRQIPLNPLIGSDIRVAFEGQKRCVHCDRKSSKLFNGGFCWPCFQKLACNDVCQIKPHLCHYETCREQAWGDRHCMIPTCVYLAKSSDIKVGISRNIPGRWLNQGAVEAVPIALVPNRKMAGELEIFLSRHIRDKTDWRRMLRGDVTETVLTEERQRLIELIPQEYREYLLTDEAVQRFHYPVEGFPEKLASHDIEKAPAEGRLLGIKGSYLILNTGVLNLPKFTGFCISLDAPDMAEISGLVHSDTEA